jgi:hypothetical protein
MNLLDLSRQVLKLPPGECTGRMYVLFYLKRVELVARGQHAHYRLFLSHSLALQLGMFPAPICEPHFR